VHYYALYERHIFGHVSPFKTQQVYVVVRMSTFSRLPPIVTEDPHDRL